ncbi:MAG: hypothetical protein ACYCZY_11765, partial [Lacisediminihabitans sp.]
MNSGPVYVLGAGFSRAISDQMPVTDELGNACLMLDADLSSEYGGAGFSGGNFETWLSRRAEDQPYLTVAENLRARSFYFRTVELVAKVLEERQARALSVAAPDWLIHLVELWHLERATVISFNYDTLVEGAVKTAALYDADANVTVPWPTAINFTPTGRIDTTYGEAGQNADWSTFRLLKMHGSLNWYWTPGDQSGATITRGKLPGTFGHPDTLSEADRQRWLPGREPFLVPPAALKSSYYANPITKEIWRQAFRALKEASRVTFLGYSLPQTDLSVTGMISESFNDAADRDIDIVDLAPDSIRERVDALRDGLRINSESGQDAIANHVRSRRAAFLAPIPQKIADGAKARPGLGVVVSWNEGAIAAALTAERVGDVCVVTLEGIGQIWFATRADRATRSEIDGHSNRPALTSERLAEVVEGC